MPEYIQRGDSQDIGSGSALTSFLQLPGGGFYDNYRDRTSPQGIRPIHKGGLLIGTAAELKEQLSAWRSKIGKRDKLTVEFDDGSLRWQWARLQDFSAPRPSQAKGGWLAYDATWITAAQNWRGVVYVDEGWTWGDGSWVFGDGTTEFGVGSQTFTLADSDDTVTVTHNGDIDAPNVNLILTTTGTWQDVTVINETTGQQIVIERDSSVATPWIEINAGARTLYQASASAKIISSIFRDQNFIQVTTNSAHGIATGGTVKIAGTGKYDGIFQPVTSTGTSAFRFDVPGRHPGYGTVTTGTAQGLTDAYDLATISDLERWLVLAPGDNTLRVIWSTFPTSASLTVEYDDHYA